MNGDGNILNYGAADFERYYNGSMAEEERNALEKAALDDTFLADALDGYEFSFSPVIEVDELSARLNEKGGKVKNTALGTLLRIAASAVLIIGFGLMIYKITNKNTTAGFAQVDKKTTALPAQQQLNSAEDQKGDRVLAKAETQLQTAQPAASPAPALTTTRSYGNTSRFDSVGSPATKNVVLLNEVAYNQSGAKSKDAYDYNFNKISNTQNRVVLNGRDNNQVYTQPTTGFPDLLYGSIQNADSSGQLAYNQYDMKKDAAVVGAPPDKNTSSGIVVTGYGTLKSKPKRAYTNNELESKLKYYRLHYPADTGIVVLRYNTDKKGSLIKFKIIKQTCAPCGQFITGIFQHNTMPFLPNKKDMLITLSF